ncbi:universal stress protein [Catellatospora sp. TT07R-123]|uniref:universal stress protein n=1 Tax=Catellatospora sp. TT07R-123 TaxID=2733863 RepID=UPI001B27595D|nr:universal stress protein [Catellatospora sp. TT07R-123]GHJ44553.1 universal stress protein [Catellatospora sp. TT07R-123]
MGAEPAGPIVVGVDGSPAATEALDWAAAEAQLRGLPLRLVYAGDDPGPRLGDDADREAVGSAAQDVAEHAAQRVRTQHPDLAVEAVVVRDDPAHALIRESDTAWMVVVGSRGHGGFHDLMLGSTSLQTAMHANSCVAVVRPAARASRQPVGEAPGRIVVGVDGSAESDVALRFAFDEAQRRGCGVTAVHAWLGPITTGAAGMPFVYDMDTLRAQEESVVETALAPYREQYPHVETHRMTVESSAAAALTEHSMGAALVVVGCRGLGGFSGLLLGSVSQALIHHAGCPVVVAHERGRH